MASDRALRLGLVALAVWNGVLLTMLFARSSSGTPAWLQESPIAQVRLLQPAVAAARAGRPPWGRVFLRLQAFSPLVLLRVELPLSYAVRLQ